MSLTVLTDDQVRSILEDLSLEEAEALRNSLKAALHQYSTGTQAVTDGDIHQPERTSITSGSTGATTLFMPSSSTAGVGMKGERDTQRERLPLAIYKGEQRKQPPRLPSH